MKYDLERHHRRSIRLRNYDYTQEGIYYITICTKHSECLFGRVVDGRMRLNALGEIVWEEWLRSEVIRPGVSLDVFVAMPNHVHGLIVLTGAMDAEGGELTGATQRVARTGAEAGLVDRLPGRDVDDTSTQISTQSPSPAPPPAVRATRWVAPVNSPPSASIAPKTTLISGSVGAILGQFKSASTRRINQLRGTPGTPLWHRNYYEHIVRNEISLNCIRTYILENPLRWTKDTAHLSGPELPVKN